MEVKSTFSSLYGDRGAGRKFGKFHVRKHPATSYDRTPVNLATRGNSSSWWSKLGGLVRLVSGATKLILPSFLTKSPAILPSKKDEINRLTLILNSIDGNKTTNSGHTAGVKLTPFPKVSDEKNQEDVSKAIVRSPRTLLYSNAKDDVGASPVDIAKAYMSSRMSEPGRGSYNSVPKDGTAAYSNHAFVLKPFTPSYSRKSSTCWPGAVVHDLRGHIAPSQRGRHGLHDLHGHITPSQRGRYGLHDFPRNPYSRILYSKSRSKLTQLQADNSQTTSSKAFPQTWTPIFGQAKSRNDALDDNYRSVGPIRRIHNKFASEAKSIGSILMNPSKDASPFQRASASKDFAPMPKNNLEAAKTSKHWQGDHSGNKFKEPVQTLNPASSKAAKRILEQLNRSKPTPKEKAAELNLAMSWSKSLPKASDAVQKENISVRGSGKFGNTDSFEPHLLTQGNKNEGNSDRFTKLQKRRIEAEDALQKKKGRWEERAEHRSIDRS